MKLFDFVTYSLWINIIIGVFCFKSLNQHKLRYLLGFQIISSVADFFLIYVLPMQDGLFVRYFYCFLKPFEYLVYIFLFNNKIQKQGAKFYCLIFSFLILFSYSIYNIVFRIDSKSASNNVIILEGCLVLILVMFYFKDILNSKEVIILTKEPLFWIATGLLFFYSGNIIATGFYHRLREYSKDFAKSLYTLNFILGITMSMLFSIAYLVANKNSRKHE